MEEPPPQPGEEHGREDAEQHHTPWVAAPVARVAILLASLRFRVGSDHGAIVADPSAADPADLTDPAADPADLTDPAADPADLTDPSAADPADLTDPSAADPADLTDPSAADRTVLTDPAADSDPTDP